MNSWKQFFITTLAAICLLMPAATHADELETLVNLQTAGRADSRDISRNEADNLIGSAMGLLGVAYRYGGTSANTGFDCSGFVRNVYADALGLVLPRVARDQANATKKIEKKELRPGDLVFFNTMRRTFSHVGIYLGEGKFIHSPRSGAKVRIESMNTKYWSARFNGARRVASVGSLSSTGAANYSLAP